MITVGFSNLNLSWFKSYLSNRLFKVNLENFYSDPFNITGEVPQGLILGSLQFLMYVNDMSRAVKSNLFLYADRSCLVFQGEDVMEIEKQFNGDFTDICKWFMDNRLRIHFTEDETESILIS